MAKKNGLRRFLDAIRVKIIEILVLIEKECETELI